MHFVADAFLSSDQLLSSRAGLELGHECRGAVLDILMNGIRVRCVVFERAPLRTILSDGSCVDFCHV